MKISYVLMAAWIMTAGYMAYQAVNRQDLTKPTILYCVISLLWAYTAGNGV